MKYSRLSAVCLLPLVFIILFSVSEAGFIDDGVPIADGDGMQTAPLITSSPGGGAIIVWEDQAVPGTALMAQKIDGLGRYRWDPSGVRVSAGTSPQDEPSVLSDGAGGLFIAWKDGLDIYAQHLDDGGAPLWTAEGVPVCAADGEQQRPGICPGPDGGIIVCWLDSRPGAQGIYGQRLGASGLPVWAVDGIVVHDPAASTLKVCSDGQGGAIIAYDCAGLRTQRVRSDGTIAWTPGGVFIWENEFSHSLSGIVYDNRFGAIIFWEARIGLEGYNVTRQHVDSTGTSRYGLRATNWTTNPGGLSPSVAVDDDGGYILAYLDDASGPPWPYCIATRKDRNGDHKWSTTVCAEGNTGFIRAGTDGRRGAHFLFADDRSGVKVYSQHVDSMGTRTLPNVGVALAPGSPAQGYGVICHDGSGGAIMAWTDYREGYDDADVYAGAIDASGEVVATLLSGFSVQAISSGIVVSWSLTEMDANVRFEIIRREGVDAIFVPADGELTVEGMDFSFTDGNCEAGKSYSYRVSCESGGQRRLLFETDPVSLPSAEPVLYQNVPNPFNPSTVIAFDLPVRRHVKVSIYDAAGRHVAVIMDEVAGPGKATVDWNGTDDAGSSVASGVYFCRLVAGKDVLTRKMTLLR